MIELKPCPKCNDAWMYASVGVHSSGYETYGYRVKCKCGYAWKTISWHDTAKGAIEAWNRRAYETN